MRAPQVARALFAVVLLTLAAPAFGGLNRWTSSGPEGGSITAIVVHPGAARTVYAATAGGGIFRSTSADSPGWQSISAGLPEPAVTALALHAAASPSVLYAGTAAGQIYRSRDNGDTWSAVEKPSSGGVRGFAFDNVRRRMYAATESGLRSIRSQRPVYDR